MGPPTPTSASRRGRRPAAPKRPSPVPPKARSKKAGCRRDATDRCRARPSNLPVHLEAGQSRLRRGVMPQLRQRHLARLSSGRLPNPTQLVCVLFRSYDAPSQARNTDLAVLLERAHLRNSACSNPFSRLFVDLLKRRNGERDVLADHLPILGGRSRHELGGDRQIWLSVLVRLTAWRCRGAECRRASALAFSKSSHARSGKSGKEPANLGMFTVALFTTRRCVPACSPNR